MLKVFKKWVDSYFADEEAITLLALLLIGLLVVIYAGHIVAPIIASIIIAYLLQGMVQRLERWVPYSAAVTVAFLFFVGVFLLLILLALPIIGQQLTSLVTELPGAFEDLQGYFQKLQQQYPTLIPESQVQDLVTAATQEVGNWGQSLLSFSIASLPNVFAIMVYTVLIPIMVFFFLKDKKVILGWLMTFLPKERTIMTQVWEEMNMQVANYARGKAVEIFIVGMVTYITFLVMGLQFAALLGFLVGLSVIVPYIGAVVVTVPVAMVAYFQWGMTDTFGYVLLAYGIIQFLDGNVLVPFLFSEAVNMHPVAIIIAVLVFGGFWGMWGVFFAIPLATLVKALMQAWPDNLNEEPEVVEEQGDEAHAAE